MHFQYDRRELSCVSLAPLSCAGFRLQPSRLARRFAPAIVGPCCQPLRARANRASYLDDIALGSHDATGVLRLLHLSVVWARIIGMVFSIVKCLSRGGGTSFLLEGLSLLVLETSGC